MAIIAKLLVRSGVQAGSDKEIRNDLLRIGRDPANDFVVDDIEVSRNHAKITRNNDIYTIEDLNSTNGTSINGRKISKPEQLRDGDLIYLGESNVFEFSLSKENQLLKPSEIIEGEELEKDNKNFFSKKTSESDFEKVVVTKTPEEEKNLFKTLSKLPTWAIILAIALGFIVLFCLIPLILIEISDQWCNLFSGFFNAISPGVCL